MDATEVSLPKVEGPKQRLRWMGSALYPPESHEENLGRHCNHPDRQVYSPHYWVAFFDIALRALELGERDPALPQPRPFSSSRRPRPWRVRRYRHVLS